MLGCQAFYVRAIITPMKNNKTRNNLSKNVRKYRLRKKLTQEKVSEIADIEYKYYQAIEGKNPPNITLNTLERIAKALNTSTADLLKE